jgi:hypothetical protein
VSATEHAAGEQQRQVRVTHLPPTMLDVSDPTSWGLNSWLSDLVPHLAYELTTAVAYDALAAA